MSSRTIPAMIRVAKTPSTVRQQAVVSQRRIHQAIFHRSPAANIPSVRSSPAGVSLPVSTSTSDTYTLQRRAFHASHAAAMPAKNPEAPNVERVQTESSWTRPHKPSQDADDDTVPEYYVARKRQGDEISERKEAEGSLMAQLAAGILSEGIAAQTRIREEKIPVEVKLEDGTVRHPSGFEPPTPETDFHPESSKTPTVDDPLLTTVKVQWDEALAPSSDTEPQTTVAHPDASKKTVA